MNHDYLTTPKNLLSTYTTNKACKGNYNDDDGIWEYPGHRGRCWWDRTENKWCFRPWFCTVKLYWAGDIRWMRWILLWIMPLMQDQSGTGQWEGRTQDLYLQHSMVRWRWIPLLPRSPPCHNPRPRLLGRRCRGHNGAAIYTAHWGPLQTGAECRYHDVHPSPRSARYST